MDRVIEIIKKRIKASKKGFITYEELAGIISENLGQEKNDFIIKSLESSGEIYFKNGRFFEFPTSLHIGNIESTKKNTYYITLPDGTKLFIKDENLNGALAYDTIVYSIDDANCVIVENILKRNTPNIVCEINKRKDQFSLIPRNIKGKIRINANSEDLEKIGEGKFVLVKVSDKQINGEFSGEILKNIELNGSIDNALALIALSNGFELDFPEEVKAEAKKIPDHVTEKEIEARKKNDFRNKIIFTIDGLDTKDIDDAISLEILPNGNYELGVHIANVSHYVKPGSSIYNDAKLRSTSLYMLNTVIPMLPKELSNGVCSLNEGVDRLAKSVIMEIDHKGNIIDSRICDSIIHSKKKMNYDDVNKVINGETPEGYEEFESILKQMNKLSKILSAKRSNLGSINFANQEIKINLDEAGNPVEFTPRESLAAEKLIENFMVSANETVATYVGWMNLPFVYRTHQGPNKFKLEEALNIIKSIGFALRSDEVLKNPKMVHYILEQLKDTEEYPILSNILLRSMAKAKYSTENIGHFALASKAYTHFTSPIRRFPDLTVHSLLDYYNEMSLGNEKFDKSILDDLEESLEEECAYASIRERQADKAEYEADKSKMIEFMRNLVGTTFEATIDMINNRAITITTDDGIPGIVSYEDISGDKFIFHDNNYTAIGRNTKIKYKIGNRVLVTLLKVDDFSQNMYFSIDKKIVKLTSPDYQLKKTQITT